MRLLRPFLIVQSLACVAIGQEAREQEPTVVPGFIRELRPLDVTLPDGTPLKLDALITRPDKPGRLPLVILSHGAPRDTSARIEMTPTHFSTLAFAFARRGYGTVLLIRRGYGRTGGEWVEAPGPCHNRDYVRSAHLSAEDILAGLSRLAKENWVDAGHVLLVGHSAGGMASLAAGAANPPGVVGVISFAGGRGSDGPNHVCEEDRLVSAMGELGRTAHVASLWIYSQNDQFFAPALATAMHDAYVKAGAPAELMLVPAYGEDGHQLVLGPSSAWWSDVEPFLRRLGLPTELVTPRAATSLKPPASLSDRGRAAFADYAASDGYEKAFATDGKSWGWATGQRTRAEAEERALARCAEHGEHCTVYAVGDGLAP